MHSPAVNRPRQMLILLGAALILLVILVTHDSTLGQNNFDWRQSFSYLSPLPDAEMVSPGTSIALRGKQMSGEALYDAVTFTASGSHSGKHIGHKVLAEDGETVLFYPAKPFHPQEQVQAAVEISEESFSYSFQVSDAAADHVSDAVLFDLEQGMAADGNRSTDMVAEAPTALHTAPFDMPRFEVIKGAGTVDDGYVFVSPFDMPTFGGEIAYLFILDNDGEPIYYQRLDGEAGLDFKIQGNGQLTYYDRNERRFIALDNQYEIERYYSAGNGYPTNMHDLQILDNGNYLITIYDAQTIDMSEIVPGGQPEANVLGCIIQELDSAGNVVFQWRSWDYFELEETTRDLTFENIDYVHCNSIERDSDGNLLLSSRNFDEVTKINRQSGDIIWRMGGKKNEFTFTNDTGFSRQHDARRLANGHMTLYDNGVTHSPQRSRGIELEVDESSKKVSVVNEYHITPDIYARYMGNVQRLSGGNTVVGWGFTNTPVYAEFDELGASILEFNVMPDVRSYRAFRFPWQGHPTWSPTLVANANGLDVKLFFSWNGSTETDSFMIYGTPEGAGEMLLDTVSKDGFETSFEYTAANDGIWKFRVVAVDKDLVPIKASNIVTLPIGQTVYMPLAASP